MAAGASGQIVVPAERAKTPGWKDPRMWFGVALVALSVLIGARVLSAADQTTPVWALAVGKEAGEELTEADLVSRNVHFADEEDLASYLPADETVPPGTRMLRAVGPGELLPRASFGTSVATGVVEVPLEVASAQVPPAVEVGSVVDVWAVDENAADAGQLRPIFGEVVVIAAPRSADGFVDSGARQLVIGLPEQRAAEIGPALAASAAGTLVITRHG